MKYLYFISNLIPGCYMTTNNLYYDDGVHNFSIIRYYSHYVLTGYTVDYGLYEDGREESMLRQLPIYKHKL